MKSIPRAILLISSLSLFLGECKKEPEEFIQTNVEKYVPEKTTGKPVIYEEYNLILQSSSQNYIKRNEESLKIAVSSGGKLDGYSEKCDVNYRWRDLNDINGKFHPLFKNDVAILSFIEGPDPFGANLVKMPYFLFVVIDSDTNQNQILDSQYDTASLYIFRINDKKLIKISPPDVNIERAYQSTGFSSYDEPSRHPVSAYESVVFFKGTDQDENEKYYLYHISKNKLEILPQ